MFSEKVSFCHHLRATIRRGALVDHWKVLHNVQIFGYGLRFEVCQSWNISWPCLGFTCSSFKCVPLRKKAFDYDMEAFISYYWYETLCLACRGNGLVSRCHVCMLNSQSKLLAHSTWIRLPTPLQVKAAPEEPPHSLKHLGWNLFWSKFLKAFYLQVWMSEDGWWATSCEGTTSLSPMEGTKEVSGLHRMHSGL